MAKAKKTHYPHDKQGVLCNYKVIGRISKDVDIVNCAACLAKGKKWKRKLKQSNLLTVGVGEIRKDRKKLDTESIATSTASYGLE